MNRVVGTVEMDEPDLIELVKQGDREAFERLYRELSGKLYGFCLRMTGRSHEAEEMTQEVFVRAWKNRRSFKSVEHAKNWLFRVATNLRCNELRTVARRGAPVALEIEPVDPGAGERSSARTVRVDLEKAVRVLADGPREVLVLHDIYGYKHREIAELLEMSINTSKVQLHRARKRLREVMS